MTKLSKDDVLKLARLARISVSDDEVERYREEFSAILGYIDQLDSVDVFGLQPTSQVTGLVNVFRDDMPIDYGVTPKALLSNVPQVQADQIKVRRMIG